MEKRVRRDTLQVSLVTMACLGAIIVITTQVLHVGADLAIMGPVILFLGYLVSRGWTPVPEWSPSWYWGVSIILTTVIEIIFAYRY